MQRHSTVDIRQPAAGIRQPGFGFRLSLCIVLSALCTATLADALTWSGSTNLTMTAATVVFVPSGKTNAIEELSGAYRLTKTGPGALEIRYVKSSGASVVVSEGAVRFANPRPDDIFARAYFHVDASDTSTMAIETVNGTNFVTRWNDADGRAERYAYHCTTAWNCRTDPENRKPFLREGFQNGLPVMDFGSLLTKFNTNELGQALGYGAAMTFDQVTPYIKEGFTVASDTEDYDYWPTVPSFSTAMDGMSFFSHETAWRFMRRDYSPTGNAALGIMANHKNNNDYFEIGKSVWYDGVLLTSHPIWTRPSIGFHIFRIRPSADGNTTFKNFAAEYVGSSNRSYGGQRIAEYVLFTNRTETGESTMTAAEATMVNRYLRVKWFAQSISAVTVERGASLDIDASANLSVGKLAADGGTDDLHVDGCVTNRVPYFGATVHFDAARADTMELSKENGTNFVVRWFDADGGPSATWRAVPETQTGRWGQRANPERRLPFISLEKTQNGLPVVDLGPVVVEGVTNSEGVAIGYGASLAVVQKSEQMTATRPSYSVAEYLAVISDTEDLKTQTQRGGQIGPAYVAYTKGGNNYEGMVAGRRGKFVANKYPGLFTAMSGNNIFYQNGTNYVNGVKQTYSYTPPDGFSIINIRPSAPCGTCNAIGRYLRFNGSSSYIDTYGGQRIAEYLVFGSVLSEERRERIYRTLRRKWFGDAPATTNFYNNLALGESAVMEVGYDESVAVMNTLTLAGRLTAASANVANMAVASTNATLAGALTLADGANVSFERLPDGTWTSLAATSLAAEGAVSVSLSGNPTGLGGKSVRLIATDSPPASLDGWTVDYPSDRITARLALRDDGVWAEFFSVGTILFVR